LAKPFFLRSFAPDYLATRSLVRDVPIELNALTVLAVQNGYCALFTDVALQFLGLQIGV